MRWPILLLLFLSSSVNAQIHFPDSTAQWNHCCSANNGNGEPYPTGSMGMFLNGDTVIQSLTYTKVFLGSSIGEFSDTASAEYLGGLRESFGRVYYVGGFDSGNENILQELDSVPDEILLYDFNVAVGDTITHLVNYHTQQGNLEIDSIFSIVFERDTTDSQFGTFRTYRAHVIRSHWELGSYYSYFMEETNAQESHGDLSLGLFGPLKTVFEHGCPLYSFYSPDYNLDQWSPWLCATVGIDDHEIENCFNYSQNAIISSCNSPNAVISIYNMTGKLVHSKNYNPTGGFDCSFLPHGIYLAVVESENQRSVLKFAVTH